MKPIPFLLSTVLALGCGESSTTVKGKTCDGCRDAMGFCLPGNTELACGLEGASCAGCEANAACQHGRCVASTVGGGAGGGNGGSADAGFDDCSAEARLIYVVDQNRTLSSFDPRLLGAPKGPFAEVGRLACPAKPGAEPFSMAVDRSATAWIVYDSGELFTASIKDLPLRCVKTSFQPQYGVAMFGMGFVANTAGSKDETLHIAGSDFNASLTTTKFGTLSTSPPHAVTLLGTLNGAPELTGTGDAKLWAFSPNLSPPRVARLSRLTGAEESGFEAPSLTGSPRAWAFAFWGGDFFIFLERSADASTGVWRMNGLTGALSQALPETGRRIVGAGVSTCAPVEIN